MTQTRAMNLEGHPNYARQSKPANLRMHPSSFDHPFALGTILLSALSPVTILTAGFLTGWLRGGPVLVTLSGIVLGSLVGWSMVNRYAWLDGRSAESRSVTIQHEQTQGKGGSLSAIPDGQRPPNGSASTRGDFAEKVTEPMDIEDPRHFG
jgi:hypothetical protein